MENIESAMAYVEDSIQSGDSLTEHFVRELHAITVKDLEREGDTTPGAYRLKPVQIAQSDHLPPDIVQVPEYMQALVSFINENHPPKYDLIKVALAHHRFGWIHPFGNDRDRYYAMLACADKGSPEALEEWCVYVLQGILDELRKVDQLTDFSFFSARILAPALTYAREREHITAMEEKILHITAKSGVAKAADLAVAMPAMTAARRTYQIKKLVDRNMLQPVKDGARQYTIGFSNSYLMRGVVHALTHEGFIPPTLSHGDMQK
jgi:Fic family protein